MSNKEIQINKKTIKLSKLGKLFYPEANIYKGDVIEYYRRMEKWILPHLKGRPLSLQRFPDGIKGNHFYQKEAPDYFPAWIKTTEIQVKEKSDTQQQVLCDNKETLIYLANQASLVFHIWLSRAGHLNYPDKLIFDLDPPGSDFETVKKAARSLKDIIEGLLLHPFLMTTGSRGLHVVVPVKPEVIFDKARNFARDLVERIEELKPGLYSTEVRINKREGKIFLDYLRNSYAQTSVAPYSLRAKPGAPVATPLDWNELDRPDLNSQSYTISNIFRRLGQKEDPWNDFSAKAGSILKAIEVLNNDMIT